MHYGVKEVKGYLKTDLHESFGLGDDVVHMERVSKPMNEEDAFHFLIRAGFYPEKHGRILRVSNAGSQQEGFLLKDGKGVPMAFVFKIPGVSKPEAA